MPSENPEGMAEGSKANGAGSADFFEEVDTIVAEQDRELLAHTGLESNGAAPVPYWQAPIPLDMPSLPAFPENTFPPHIESMISATAAATETPRELAMGMALGVLAAAIQGKARVKVAPDYSEPLSIWSISPLESGNRKSAVVQRMTKPLTTWESERLQEMKPEIARALSELETARSQVQNLRTKAARLERNSSDFAEASRLIADIESELDAREVPRAPRVWAQDVTPERLGVLMAENEGRLALISDEGGLFDTFAGRYSRGGLSNIDVLLQGHAGSPHRVDRGNRPPVLIHDPAVTIVVSPQPEVLAALGRNRDFRGRGFLARLIYFLPVVRAGYRTGQGPATPVTVASTYSACVTRLLELTRPASGPFVIELAEPARAEWLAFFQAVEKERRDGGRFEHARDWSGKAPGMAARVAGLIHCAEHAFAGGDPSRAPLSLATMQRALDFAAVAAEHALAAYGLMGADDSVAAARKLWSFIERRCKPSFSFRDAFQALRGSFARSADLEPAFDVLVERSYIAPKEERSGRVGRPTRIYEVNPALTAEWEKS